MAGPLRKTMVYLGLADEDYAEESPAQTAQTAPPAQPAAVPAAVPARSAVTPLRRSTPPTTKNVASLEMNEILTVQPRQYKDAQVIAESFREGIPVIINLSQMTDPDARRLIDFASGLSQGLYGKIERVTKQVFLLSPAHVVVSGDHSENDHEVDASFFARE